MVTELNARDNDTRAEAEQGRREGDMRFVDGRRNLVLKRQRDDDFTLKMMMFFAINIGPRAGFSRWMSVGRKDKGMTKRGARKK